MHNIKVSYSTIRRVIIQEGFHKIRKRKKSKYFSQKSRKEYSGELVQFDGFYHDWLEDRALENEQMMPLAI